MTAVVPLKLLVGLGNPGAQYQRTRHNAGFWFLEELASQGGVRLRTAVGVQGETAVIQGPTGLLVHLLKPMSFMNRSGQPVSVFARYHRVQPREILVAHDELDFAPGVARVKVGGGHGGHNGLRDIIACLGSADFLRLRLGIGHPEDRARTAAYVLSVPPPAEGRAIREAIGRVMEVLPALLAGDASAAMNRLNVV